ncbi:MAG TPA: hypothetical protein PLV01_09530, partial [Candidatus Kapabacteria bacterium]|nr:hypothetical protein [Candidatus Kapabacteria bacterium]
MKKIDLYQILQKKAPKLFHSKPSFIASVILYFLEKILKIRLINSFLERNGHLKGIDFMNALFDELNFTYNISEKSK